MTSSTTQHTIVRIGLLSEFEVDHTKRVDIGNLRLCVVHHGDAIHAIDDLCTHGQAFLSEGGFDPHECVVECPLHGGLFDVRTGKACGAPATRATRVYPTHVKDGEVYIDVHE
jgi:nitrite reductase/ring-hydroxylating ferredoxin subunit